MSKIVQKWKRVVHGCVNKGSSSSNKESLIENDFLQSGAGDSRDDCDLITTTVTSQIIDTDLGDHTHHHRTRTFTTSSAASSNLDATTATKIISNEYDMLLHHSGLKPQQQQQQQQQPCAFEANVRNSQALRDTTNSTTCNNLAPRSLKRIFASRSIKKEDVSNSSKGAMSNYAGLYDQNETVKKAKLAAAATASATAAAANNNNNAVTDSGSKTSKKQKLDENNNLQTMATMTATDDWYYTEIPETNCLITERDNDDNDFERQLLQAPSSATKNRYQNQLPHLDYDSDVNNNNCHMNNQNHHQHQVMRLSGSKNNLLPHKQQQQQTPTTTVPQQVEYAGDKIKNLTEMRELSSFASQVDAFHWYLNELNDTITQCIRQDVTLTDVDKTKRLNICTAHWLYARNFYEMRVNNASQQLKVHLANTHPCLIALACLLDSDAVRIVEQHTCACDTYIYMFATRVKFCAWKSKLFIILKKPKRSSIDRLTLIEDLTSCHKLIQANAPVAN